jgi:hypothetical protein
LGCFSDLTFFRKIYGTVLQIFSKPHDVQQNRDRSDFTGFTTLIALYTTIDSCRVKGSRLQYNTVPSWQVARFTASKPGVQIAGRFFQPETAVVVQPETCNLEPGTSFTAS